MRILNIILAASALIAAPVVRTAWADCYPADVQTLPLDEASVEQHCLELAACSLEPFEHQDCVDWYTQSLQDVSDPEEDGGQFTVDLDCYDSDDYLADPTVCDAVCGDGVCSGGEDASTCADDCGVCGGDPLPPPVSEPPSTSDDRWWLPSV